MKISRPWRRKPDIKKSCENCGKEFIILGRNTSSKKRYCCHKCSLDARKIKGLERVCIICGAQYRATPLRGKVSKDKTCSIGCYKRYRSSIPKYREPWESRYKKMRKRITSYRDLWGLILKSQDKEKCSKCGYNKCEQALEYHHVDPKNKKWPIAKILSLKPKQEYIDELSKCICLCANCHREEHALNGKPNAGFRKRLGL